MIKKYREVIILSGCLIVISQLYLYTMFPVFKNDDSPETITSAYTLGISHPPGYPLFTMAGKVFSLLPVGSPAFRVNSFAIFLAMIVLLLSYFIIKKISLHILSYENKTVNFLGVFILAFSYIFWNQATEAKGGIYILNLLFFAILLYFSAELFSGFTVKYPYFISFIYGLSLANHWPSMIILLPVFGYLGFKYRAEVNLKNIITAALLLLAGLSPYLYLPLRSGTDNIFIFMARPNTWENFWWTIFRAGYNGLVPPPSLHLYEYQIKEFFTLLLNNYSIFWVLIFAGGYFMHRKSKNLFYFYTSAFLIISFVVVIINRGEEVTMWSTDIFLMPSQYILMLFIISAIYFILGFFTRRAFRYIFLALISLLIVFIGYKNFENNNNRYNYQAYDFGNNILKTMSKNSLYLCEGDNYIMPLYYIQIIEKQRQDIKFMPVEPLAFKWGIDNFAKKYGNIALKENDPGYNLNNIISYYAGNNIDIFKSTYSMLKGYNLKQTGLLQEYLKINKPMSPAIYELYSYNRGLYDKYIEHSRLTSELVIAYLSCMLQQGIELLYDKDLSGALQIYKKAMCFPFKDEMKANEPIFYYKLSYIYKDLNDKDYQIKYLKKAIGLKENFWEAYQELGEVYSKDGNSAMAKEMFENTKKYGGHDTQVAGQASPDNNEAKKYLSTGDIKFKTGDNTGAIQDFTRAIELDPEYAEAYLDRGVAKKKLGNYKEAINDYTKAIELNPEYASAYNNRANAEYSLNDYSGAVKDYDEAIKINPDYAEAYYNCGVVKDKLGDRQGAIEDLNKAEELGIKQAYDKIREIRGK